MTKHSTKLVLATLTLAGLFLCPALAAREKEKSVAGTVDQVFRACADAAKKHYTIETINQPERRLIEGGGGKVVILPGVPGRSTSNVIAKLAKS